MITACLIVILALGPVSAGKLWIGTNLVLQSSIAASWAQAIGSVAAVAAAIWISTEQYRKTKKENGDALRSDRYAAIALSIHASSMLRSLVYALRSEDLFKEATSGNYSTSLMIVDRHLASLPPHFLRDRSGLEQYAQIPGILLQARNWLGTLEINIHNIPPEHRLDTSRMCADGIEGLAQSMEGKIVALAHLYGFVGVEEHVFAVGLGRYPNPFAPVDAIDIRHPETDH